MSDELYWSRLKRKIVSAWLLIAVAPSIPLLVVLIVQKVWELAWPIILAAFVLLIVVILRRFLTNQSWRWR